MNNFKEQPKFEIRPVIEQKPFENLAVQSFFKKWCEINDSIQPEIVKRDEWEKKRASGILEKLKDNKQTLFIPEDLRLWEMVGVMEAVDNDTFAKKPERREEAKEKLLSLGKIFQNAGAYIAQRIDGIENGREIAEALASEFYEYGQSLVSGKKSEKHLDIAEIASQNITSSEIETIDRFLAGDDLYESRRKRAEKSAEKFPSKKDELYEAERQKTLAQFFRVAEKSFLLKKKSETGQLSGGKIWLKLGDEAPIHSAFLARIEKAMARKIETPKKEFHAAIFRRGLEKLASEMREIEEGGWRYGVNKIFRKLDLNLKIEKRKLADALNISKLKTELKKIRASGDPAQISAKERKIADKIQAEVSIFPYQGHANNPSGMVANQYINCVGASILGGALMKEAGLNYLVGHVPNHSILFLVTEDDNIEWRDMLKPSLNDKLTNEMIEGKKKNGAPLAVSDIAAFSRKPAPEGLMFDIKGEKYKEKLPYIKEGQKQYVAVFEPEYGQQIQLLNNVANELYMSGRHQEAIEAYQQAIALEPKSSYLYFGIGGAFMGLERYKEAIEAYQRAIAIDPTWSYPYAALGDAFKYFSRHKEALEAYRKFIALADKKSDASFIKIAEWVISELEK